MTAGIAAFLPAMREAIEAEKQQGDSTDAASAEVVGDEDSRPANAHFYEDAQEMPQDIQKYWHQRHDLFSRYDEGVWLTDEAWYGVTPEPVANKIATHIAASTPSSTKVIIDAFAGAGGNAIAFALSDRWSQVYAFERDPAVLACARHNAALYGVAGRIWFVEGDCFALLRSARFKGVRERAVVFASPPWGGPAYSSEEVMSLERMEPYGLSRLMGVDGQGRGIEGGKGTVLYMPRNGDLNEVARVKARLGVARKARVTHYCVWGASKAICIFFGDDFDYDAD